MAASSCIFTFPVSRNIISGKSNCANNANIVGNAFGDIFHHIVAQSIILGMTERTPKWHHDIQIRMLVVCIFGWKRKKTRHRKVENIAALLFWVESYERDYFICWMSCRHFMWSRRRKEDNLLFRYVILFEYIFFYYCYHFLEQRKMWLA